MNEEIVGAGARQDADDEAGDRAVEEGEAAGLELLPARQQIAQPFGTGSICALSPASMLASTSAIAKTPIATTMKSMPPSSSDWPKMKRDCAVNRSVPIEVSHSPSSSDSSPLISDGPDSSTTSARPRHISAKYSGEQN